MKRNYAYLFNFVLVLWFVLSGFSTGFSQKAFGNLPTFGEELRPFDFSDKTYYENGVEPSLIINRRDGTDGQSVFDAIDDPRFRNVRVLSVYPAYNENGTIVYWNLYGELFEEGFRRDTVGKRAFEQAHSYPLYIFPSRRGETAFRQAHVIRLGDSYFEKNFLGLSVQVLVEFTDRIYTADGQREMAALAERNGVSADGTPIIRTAGEIEDLTGKNYVTQKIRGFDNASEPAYAIAKVIRNPQFGAIAPDAFLLNDLQLKSELNFAREFECLQTEGNWCGR